MKSLSKDQVIKLHNMLIKETGGLNGIRDKGLLESSLNAPFQTFDGKFIYNTIQLKVAKLTYFIITNHPFIDGNKRTGIIVMKTILEINGMKITSTDKELVSLGLGIANKTISESELLNWITDHI